MFPLSKPSGDIAGFFCDQSFRQSFRNLSSLWNRRKLLLLHVLNQHPSCRSDLCSRHTTFCWSHDFYRKNSPINVNLNALSYFMSSSCLFDEALERPVSGRYSLVLSLWCSCLLLQSWCCTFLETLLFPFSFIKQVTSPVCRTWLHELLAYLLH